jgi:hypothetical protein
MPDEPKRASLDETQGTAMRLAAERPESAQPESAVRRREAQLLRERVFRMFGEPRSMPEANQLIADLRHVLISVIQDVDVLLSALDEAGILDAAAYRERRIARMLADHNTEGGAPWRPHSYYRHSLDEVDFLRDMGLDDEAIARYQQTASDNETRV